MAHNDAFGVTTRQRGSERVFGAVVIVAMGAENSFTPGTLRTNVALVNVKGALTAEIRLDNLPNRVAVQTAIMSGGAAQAHYD